MLVVPDYVQSACVVRTREADFTMAKAYIILRDGTEKDNKEIEKELRKLCQKN